jgi:hypothetical protein
MDNKVDENKINVPVETLIKALVEAHVNISINSLIKALSDANINVVKNERSVDISKNVPVVLKTEIANDIEPKNNYIDTATGISPPSSDVIEEDISYLLPELEVEPEQSQPQEQVNDEFSDVITEALNYIKQKQSNQEPLEDEPSEPIKQPLVIEIPSPKSLETQPQPQIPPTPRAVQPEIQKSVERQVYYHQVLVPQPQPFPIHHYIIQPIIQPIIQFIPQPVQHFMQQFRPQPPQQHFHRYR